MKRQLYVMLYLVSIICLSTSAIVAGATNGSPSEHGVVASGVISIDGNDNIFIVCNSSVTNITITYGDTTQHMMNTSYGENSTTWIYPIVNVTTPTVLITLMPTNYSWEMDISSYNNNTNSNNNNNSNSNENTIINNIDNNFDGLAQVILGPVGFVLIIAASVGFLVLFGLALADLAGHSYGRRS